MDVCGQAGATAWGRATRQLGALAEEHEAAARGLHRHRHRKLRLRQAGAAVFAAMALVVPGTWLPGLPTGWRAVLLLLAILGPFAAHRSVRPLTVSAQHERDAARRCDRLAARPLEDAGVVRDGGWQVEALTSIATGQQDTSAELAELLAAPWSLWHDARSRNDPALLLDHVAAGSGGLFALHTLALPGGSPVCPDVDEGLVRDGVPLIGLPGEGLVRRQLRAAATLAHAADLDIDAAVSVVVVRGARLVDPWGARIELAAIEHAPSGALLAYCTPAGLGEALLRGRPLTGDRLALVRASLRARLRTDVSAGDLEAVAARTEYSEPTCVSTRGPRT